MILISPAKSLANPQDIAFAPQQMPFFEQETAQIVKKMQKLKPPTLKELMQLSDALTQLNYQRYQQWNTENIACPALFYFKGDVYQGLDAETLNEKQLNYAATNLRILSGLYGIMRPFDAMKAYRLEMGTTISVGKAKNLYQFWQAKITKRLQEEMNVQNATFGVNLASQEYAKVLDFKQIKQPFVSPVFKQYKNGVYKIISFSAKRARGLMARFILENELKNIADLQAFNAENYRYSAEMSKSLQPVFLQD
ncbi:MAG: peroxide stress protein YaaA [Chitinophagales bacterium]|nr:peroxide stress protein YaaA [Bacteroidota bacterium]MCB9043752.1 peroxide stress protein YaaA [Chitinophagales bacterium]